MNFPICWPDNAIGFEDFMRFARPLAICAAAMAGVVFAASVAEAQSRPHKGSARTITIQKRSFLNSGPIVPLGSLRNYQNDSTVLFVPTSSRMGPGFGAGVLPGRFDVPGRPSPLFTF